MPIPASRGGEVARTVKAAGHDRARLLLVELRELLPTSLPGARGAFFSCTTCGNPAFECKRCMRVATERDLAPVTTCAYCCSLQEEVNAAAHAS